MKPIVIIPARGGSKGIPKKNIKLLNGKPLIQYTIDAAKEVFDSNSIIVSTDDEEIASVSRELGAKIPYLRPDHLATDTAPTTAVIRDIIDRNVISDFIPDTVVLLQPTSPLRTANHLIQALDLFEDDLDMVVSVKESKANPYYNLFEEDPETKFLEKSKKGDFTRRQDMPSVYEYNGAIYLIRIKSIMNREIYEFDRIRKYVMDEKSSIDIDDESDWVLANYYLNG